MIQQFGKFENLNTSGRLFSSALTIACMAFLFCVNGQQPDSEVKLLSTPKFELSEEAMAAGIDGDVRLALTVGKDGVPKNPELLAGPAWPCGSNPKKALSNLEDAIKANLLSSRYAPAIKDGVPVERRIGLNFTIGQEYRQRLKDRADAEALKQGKLPAAMIRGGVVNGKALSMPRPEYPYAARGERVSGPVFVEGRNYEGGGGHRGARSGVLWVVFFGCVVLRPPSPAHRRAACRRGRPGEPHGRAGGVGWVAGSGRAPHAGGGGGGGGAAGRNRWQASARAEPS